MDPETEKKIDKLLSEMSVREKAGRLNQVILSENNVGSVRKRLIKGEIESFIMATGEFAGHDKYEKTKIKVLNELQRVAVEDSPHGIPVISGKEVIHGHITGFPIPLACASSFNTELIEKSYTASAAVRGFECDDTSAPDRIAAGEKDYQFVEIMACPAVSTAAVSLFRSTA